jgi:hypothetical protein
MRQKRGTNQEDPNATRAFEAATRSAIGTRRIGKDSRQSVPDLTYKP